jgi:hypothetical protein
MRTLFLAILIAAGFAHQGNAAVQIFQNRDEPGRNPYQATVAQACGGRTTCNLIFPREPAARIVIQSINCNVFVLNYNGFVQALLTTSSLKAQQSFYMNSDFQLHAQTSFFVEPREAPTVGLNSFYRFSGRQTCTLTGYTISLP